MKTINSKMSVNNHHFTDEAIEKRVGYKTVLHRGLGALANFAFGFTEVAVLASFTSLYGSGLSLGGPSAIVWGWLVTWLMLTIASFSMAEICSAYPSAGSVYHWSAQLVPPKYAALASYITGWTNFMGNAAGDASFASFFASFFNAGLQASRITPYDYQPSVGVAIAVLLVWSILNWFRVDQVGWVNNIAAFVHAGSIIVIIITILVSASVYGGGKGLMSQEWVFTQYENGAGFTDDSKQHALNDKSYIGAMGITIAMFSFSGFEASAHMAEETHGMATAAPMGIVWTVFATGIGGFGYLLALLFSSNNLALITTTEIPEDDYTLNLVANNGASLESFYLTDNAAVNVFINACGWNCGAGLTWLVVINLFFAGVASVAVTGRITFALLRDHAFPYSEYLKQVHPTLKSPIRAINFVFVLDALLLLLGLNPSSGSAFTAIVGLCTIGFMVSYAIPIMLKIIFQPKDFPLTPMSLGKWSTPMGIASCLWLYGTSCLFLFPQSGPLTLESNNWLIVVIAGAFVACAAYWMCGGGHRDFKGPAIMSLLTDSETSATWHNAEADNHISEKDAANEEYLHEQYIDQAAAAKKAQEATLAGATFSVASSAASAIADAAKDTTIATGSFLSTIAVGIASGADALAAATAVPFQDKKLPKVALHKYGDKIPLTDAPPSNI